MKRDFRCGTLIQPLILLLAIFWLFPRLTSADTNGTIRIMCVGDSTTAGYTDNPAWTVEFTFSYRIGLYKRMTNAGYAFQFVGESREPLNGGYGLPKSIGSPDLRPLGQDHHRGYAWMEAVLVSAYINDWMRQDQPDVILLMVGTVDFLLNTTNVATPSKQLEDLIEKVVTTWPQVHLVVAQMIPFPSYWEPIVRYNEYIRTELVPSFAARGKRVTTVNMYEKFLKAGQTDVKAVDYNLFANGFHHPNPTGYDHMAQAWFEGLQAIYPQVSPSMVNAPGLSADGHFHVRYKGQTNAIYQVERANSLPGPWESSFSLVTADSGGIFEIDDIDSGSAGPRFYRIADPYK
jgi:lysophospholipase L1-like esterase